MSPVRQSVHRPVRPPAHMVDHQYHGPATVPPTPPLQYQPSASVPQVDRMYVPTLPTGQPLARHQTGPPDPDRPPSVRTAGPAGPPQPDRQQAGMLLTTGPYDGVIPANSAQYGDHSAPLQQHQVYSNSAPPQIQTDEYASVSSVDRPVPLNPSTSYGAFVAGFPAYGAQGPASKCDVRSDRPVYSLLEQAIGTGPFVTPVTAVLPPPPTTISSVKSWFVAVPPSVRLLLCSENATLLDQAHSLQRYGEI